MIEEIICMSIISNHCRLSSKCAPLNVPTSVGKYIIAVAVVSDDDTLESVGLCLQRKKRRKQGRKSKIGK